MRVKKIVPAFVMSSPLLKLICLLLAVICSGIFFITWRPLLNSNQNHNLLILDDYFNSINEEIISDLVLKKSTTNKIIKNSSSALEKIQYKNYKIKKGDSIFAIASRFKISASTLVAVNHIKNAYDLKINSIIRIPNINGIEYSVKKGDSLLKIATLYGIRWEDIVDFNNLNSANIKPKEKIFLPKAKLSQYQLDKIFKTQFIRPVKKGRLTSGFGFRRDPITGVYSFHSGIDIADKLNTSVYAAAGGQVQYVGNARRYGKFVLIKHRDGYTTNYAHLNKVLVKKGMYVKKGDVIARMGNTGRSTGVHLHFELIRNKKHLNPLKYISY